MKLNFKEWSIVHAALVELADRQRSEVEWYEEGTATREQCVMKLAETESVIAKLEECPV